MINFFDGILILTNFLIFIIIQILFLIIISESRILKEIDYLIYFYKPWINEIRNIYPDLIKKETLVERNPDNKKLLLKTIGIPIGVIILIIILLIILGIIYNNKWETHHTIGLVLIFFAYLTELMVYFLIANEYRFINSSSVISNFIKKLKERIKYFPVNQGEITLVNNLIQNSLDNLKGNFNIINLYNKEKKLLTSKTNIKEAKKLLESKINNNEIININQNDLNKLTKPRTIP